MNTQERMKIAEKLRKMLEGPNPMEWFFIRYKYALMVKRKVRSDNSNFWEDWLYDLARQVTQRRITK